MSLQYVTKPLTDFTVFTTPEDQRKANPFRLGRAGFWSATLPLLEIELGNLDAEDIVIELGLMASDIRKDGLPRAQAKVTHPGIRLSFGSKHGPLTYTTDRFAGRWSNDPPDWQINLRAVALSLEALRKVDRYGITKNAEQYAGWKAIGSGVATASNMTPDEAREILCDYSLLNMDVARGEPIDRLLKLARRNSHPDRNNGDRHKWNGVENAARTLGVIA